MRQGMASSFVRLGLGFSLDSGRNLQVSSKVTAYICILGQFCACRRVDLDIGGRTGALASTLGVVGVSV